MELERMVDLEGQYGILELESVFSAFSCLNSDYDIGLQGIIDILDMITRCTNYREFDEMLSGELLKLQNSRLTALVHDVSQKNATIHVDIHIQGC